MEFFEPVLGPILTLLEPKSLCEIGIDKGRFSDHLMQFCSQQDCRYTGIDPSIDGDLLKQKNNAEFKLMKCSSIEALHEIEPQDIYIIDGDHNYFTVKEELKLIFRHKENRPVLFFMTRVGPLEDATCIINQIQSHRKSANPTVPLRDLGLGSQN